MQALGAAVLALTLISCVDAPTDTTEQAVNDERAALIASTRASIAQRGVTAVPRPPNVRPKLVQLGRALAFDKLLSGNHDTSCMTCHPTEFATADARHLAMGVTGTGSGPARTGDFAAGE